MEESLQQKTERYFNLLCKMFYETLPMPGVNPYSKGRTRAGVTPTRLANGSYCLEISNGIDYGRYELGFNDAGTRMSPRGINEAKNFKIVDNAINRASMILSGKGVEVK